ncbi:RICIN domain-containing protein [Streptomyces sp. NPDC003710]
MMTNRLASGMGALVLGVAVLPAISVSAAAAPIAAPATSVAGQDVLRDGGVRYFKAKHSGKCLTVHGAGTAKGAAVDQYTCLNRCNQRWRLLYTSQSGVAYVVAEHSGKCLDALGGGKANGTKIVQWDCNTAATRLSTSGTCPATWLSSPLTRRTSAWTSPAGRSATTPSRSCGNARASAISSLNRPGSNGDSIS